eukprot:COSAG01_NODE_1887_length_8982_cov_15.771474_2_plen_94_part_00
MQLPLTRGLCPYETLLPGQKCPMQGSYHDCPYSSRSANDYQVDSAHPHQSWATWIASAHDVNAIPPPRPSNYGRTPSERWATLQRLSAAAARW